MSESFLFEENDFHDESFSPAAFVAKYKRVTSLESLRDSLQRFCAVLKEKLYATINEEYKDFITITTKLDGADQRVDMLRQPLVGLRVDLSALHDGMMVSYKTLEQKMAEKAAVVSRRQAVQSYIRCLERLEDAEGVVTMAFATKNKLTAALLSDGRRGALLKGLLDDKSALELFHCSELERAGYALHMAAAFLESSQSERDENCRDSMRKDLRMRIATTTSSLVTKVKTKLISVLDKHSSMVSSLVPSTSDGAIAAALPGALDAAGRAQVIHGFPHRLVAHLLRALSVLGMNHAVSACITEALVAPHIKAILTKGRVDGAKGRGSFSNLSGALTAVLNAVSPALEIPLGTAACLLSPCTAAGDLLLDTLWKPVTAHLESKFSGMFSSGIASTLHACYTAVDMFSTEVLSLGRRWHLTLSSSPSPSSSFPEESDAPECFDTFHRKWRLDLYLQLRAAEVMKRLSASSQEAERDILKDVFPTVYREIATATPSTSRRTPGSTGGSRSAAAAGPNSVVAPVLTLPIEQVEALLADHNFSRDCKTDIPLIKCFAAEVLTCFEDSVMVAPLASRFLGLAMQVVAHLERFIRHGAVVGGGNLRTLVSPGTVTPPSSPQRTSSGRGLGQAQTATAVSDVSLVSVAQTPVQGAPVTPRQSGQSGTASSSSSSSSAAGTGVPGSDVTMPARSMQELALLATDAATFATWLRGGPARLAGKKCLPCAGADASTNAAIRAMESAAARLEAGAVALWGEVCVRAADACMFPALNNVRAIAGKFRMTNKPRPDHPSAYVKTMLTPLIELHTTYHARLSATKLVPDTWASDIVSAVAAEFLVQTRDLLETARQMDSSLQRRTMLSSVKKGGAAGAGLSDSDKITVQAYLDVRAFGEEVRKRGIETDDITAFGELVAATQDAERMLA